jgi:D-amino-acid oxidase
MASPDVQVIGAGVSGLSTALALATAGLRVSVYAADPPPRTTSAAAGALWGPHLVEASDRASRWAEMTLLRLRELAGDPVSGVREADGMAASAASRDEPPAFAAAAGPLTRCDQADLPRGFSCGWRYTAPVVDMPRYLDYLARELTVSGGLLHLGPPLRDLAEADGPVIVNCAGFGARDLVPDRHVDPIRGQVVVVANPGLTDFFVGEHGDSVTYVFPHGEIAILGGTQEHGNSSLDPDPVTAERILRACAEAEPRLAGAAVITHRVGLRPARPTVRLGTRTLDDGRPVIDNYGHGGAGITLSWGCALAVLDEVGAVLS